MAMTTENTALVAGGPGVGKGRVMLVALRNMGVDGTHVVEGEAFVCDETDGNYIYGREFARQPTDEEKEAYLAGNALFGVPKPSEPETATAGVKDSGGMTIADLTAPQQNQASGKPKPNAQ